VGGKAATIVDSGSQWVKIIIPALDFAGEKDLVVQTALGDITLASTYTVNPPGVIGPDQQAALAAGSFHSLGLLFDGSICAWGWNGYGQTSVPPPNTNFVAVAAGEGHSLGLKTDGRVVAWGYNDYLQTSVPSSASNVVAVAAGSFHSLGVKSDGSIVAWGDTGYGQTAVPAPNTNFVAVAAGRFHSLGLKSDGGIVAWGRSSEGQTAVPAPNTNFVAVAAGANHSLGLRPDGGLVAWGDNGYGQTSVPPPNTNFVAVAAGAYHSLGLKSDGSIVAWGGNDYGQTSVPSPNTNFVAVAAGRSHSLGLKSDGSIVAWGRGSEGQTCVPTHAAFGLPDGVQPKAGPWLGGYDVVISGKNLGNGADITNVTICSVSAAIVSQSSTQIVVTAGAGTPGTGDVAVCSVSHGVTRKSAVFAYQKADQTIAFPAIGDKLANDTVSLSAAASSGLPVSFRVSAGPALISDGTNLSLTGEGTVSVVASQAGDALWNAAPNVTNTFTVVPGAPPYDKAITAFTMTTANSGSLINAPAWVEGRYGNALSFSNGNYVSVPAPVPDIFNITGDLTLSLWVRPDSVSCSGVHPAYALLSSRSSNHQHPFALCILNGGALYFEYSGTYMNYPSFTSTSALKTGAWQHVLVTRSFSGDNATVTFYIDGVEAGRSTVASGPALGSTDPVWIARDGYFTALTSEGSYSGLLDEVQIYNRALSLQEVSRVMANGSALFTNRVGNWRFDESSGSTASDTVADGTINEGAKTITVLVPDGTDVTALVPQIKASPQTTLTPLSGIAQNFANPVTYTVTAEDMTAQSYTVTVAVPSGLSDADGNGLPDVWELEYYNRVGVDPEAVCSNGINTVRQAYVAGLHPNDAQSLFLIDRLRVLSTGVTFDWNTVSGRLYSVYWTTNLINGFLPLETDIPWTRGSYTNSAPIPQSFFKLDVRLAE